MKLYELLGDFVDINKIHKDDLNKEITNVTTHSAEVSSGTLFIAIKGQKVDAHNFIDSVIQNGAVFVIGERVLSRNSYFKVDNASNLVSKIAAKLYDYPSSKLKMIGVTGTDGKTTTSTIISQLLSHFIPTGYIGTNGVFGANIGELSNHYTTPHATKLQEILSLMYAQKIGAVSMEVSSHALVQKRVDDILFDVALFTNISHEHLDYHKNIDEYLEAKLKIFSKLKENGIAILNTDDKYFHKIKECINHLCITYGQHLDADYRATSIVQNADSVTFTLNTPKGIYPNVQIPMLGIFNVYNVLASLATIDALGFDVDKVIPILKNIKQVSGRMEIISNSPIKVIVDYAHTPNGISLLLENVRQICDNKIFLVVGSAGERDKRKRKDMGLIATKLSDYVIFTDEDPRSEDPNDIIQDLLQNVNTNNYCVINDRKKAIFKAFELAGNGDCIIVTGKGAENHLEYDGTKVMHNDINVCKELLAKQN